MDIQDKEYETGLEKFDDSFKPEENTVPSNIPKTKQECRVVHQNSVSEFEDRQKNNITDRIIVGILKT